MSIVTYDLQEITPIRHMGFIKYEAGIKPNGVKELSKKDGTRSCKASDPIFLVQ